jgi:hypothetical protein
MAIFQGFNRFGTVFKNLGVFIKKFLIAKKFKQIRFYFTTTKLL